MQLNVRLNTETGAIVDIRQAMQKPCGLVLVGQVMDGIVSKGDKVIFKSGKLVKSAYIKRLEVEHEEIGSVNSGHLFGLCLDNITKDELVEFLHL